MSYNCSFLDGFVFASSVCIATATISGFPALSFVFVGESIENSAVVLIL